MKITLLTGASSGIGRELAWIAAAQGHNLLLIAQSEVELDKVAAEIKAKHAVEIFCLAKDLSRIEAASEIYNYCQEKNWQVDCLINDAGFGDYGFFFERQLEKQINMINVNVAMPVALCHFFLPGMIKDKRGKILNVASASAFQPGPLMSVYYATKAFALFFSEAIANELKDRGVTVTALCPGPTESNFVAVANAGNNRLLKKHNLPSARSVAEYGYKAMLKGKRVAIPGFGNQFLAFLIRLTPRGLVLKIVRKLQEKF